MRELPAIRKDINSVDAAIRELFLLRMSLALEVAQTKAQSDDKIYKPDREAEKMFTAARKAYADGERRRVPVKFYAKVQTGEPVMAAVMDEEGHRAVLTGPVPEPAQRAPLTAQSLADQFAKTGGTPYYSTGTESRIDPDLYLPAAAVNDLRRRLITGLKEERAALPERRSLPLPQLPEGKRYFADPALIVQVHQAEQLTQELAALRPAYVYVPVEILDSDFPRLAPFLEQGAQVAAVLPRVITDDQAEDMHAMLSRAAENGVQEALVGNMGHIFFARRAGMRVRGDFGLNVFNSFTEEVLQQAGLVSATASFELRVAQIREHRHGDDRLRPPAVHDHRAVHHPQQRGPLQLQRAQQSGRPARGAVPGAAGVRSPQPDLQRAQALPRRQA